MGNPNEYNVVTVTFEVSGGDDDEFPDFSPESHFIFGNELSPFLMEFTDKMEFRFFPAPMRLQQKTGQTAFRVGHNTIYFVGGCDTTYSLFSKKFYKLNLATKQVSELDKISKGRTGFALTQLDGCVYITGGWTKGHVYMNEVEKFNLNDDSSKWIDLPPMNKARSGHFMWSCPDSKKIFAAGGVIQDGGAPLDCIECLDTNNSEQWVVLDQKLPTGLQGANAMNHSDGQHVLIIGGSTGSDPYTTSTNNVFMIKRSAFDPEQMKEPVTKMKSSRFNCFSILGGNDDQIVCIGGTNDKNIDIFDYKTFAPYNSKAMQEINHAVFDNLENFTNDLGLYTCAGC
jgi:hypothetical protein